MRYDAGMKKVVVHNGPFHADDVFAIATLQLRFGVGDLEVVRSRDKEIIESADIAVDIGSVYNPEALRFDHHQEGSPVRDNGVPYAAFGLVWKHYGEDITESIEVVNKIEERLCQPIDAADNAVSLYDLNKYKVSPVEIQSVVFSFTPIEDLSDESLDRAFMEAVDFARGYLERYISKAKIKVIEKQKAIETYERAVDKKIIVSDEHISTGHLIEFIEPLVAVSPALKDRWKARVVQVAKDQPFSARVRFPKAWAGKNDQELVEVSGIEGMLFCHKDLYLVFTETKEAAIKAARLAK